MSLEGMFERRYVWGATYDFQQRGILTSVDSETPNDVQSAA